MSCPCPMFAPPAFEIPPPPEPWLVLGIPPPLDPSCSADLTGWWNSSSHKETVLPGKPDDSRSTNNLLIYAIIGSCVGALLLVLIIIVLVRYHHRCSKKSKSKSQSKHALTSSSSASSGADRLTQWTYDYMRPMSTTQSQMTLREQPSIKEIHYASTDICHTVPRRPVSTLLVTPTNSPPRMTDINLYHSQLNDSYRMARDVDSYPHFYESIDPGYSQPPQMPLRGSRRDVR